MIIKNIKVYEISVPLVTTFKTALRTVEVVGYEEVAPTPVITSNTKNSIKGAILNFIR